MSQTAMLIDATDVLVHWTDAGCRLCDGAEAVVTRMNLADVPVVVLVQADDADLLEQRRAAVAAAVAGELAAVVGTAAASGDATRFPRPGLILQAAQASAADLFTSWVISTDPQAMRAASQAGCIGGVLIGAEPPTGLLGFTCNVAADLADAPRVMVPPQGGCWHDHRS